MRIRDFSAGSYEDWRTDKNLFPVSVRGNPLEGWLVAQARFDPNIFNMYSIFIGMENGG